MLNQRIIKLNTFLLEACLNSIVSLHFPVALSSSVVFQTSLIKSVKSSCFFPHLLCSRVATALCKLPEGTVRMEGLPKADGEQKGEESERERVEGGWGPRPIAPLHRARHPFVMFKDSVMPYVI